MIHKHREIQFKRILPDETPANDCALALAGVEGIDRLEVLAPDRLLIGYQLTHHTLADIEALLRDLGFRLDNSLMIKLKRALYAYTEETERANLGCLNGQCKTTRDVFINSYRKRPHGCRDPRPPYWRDYL